MFKCLFVMQMPFICSFSMVCDCGGFQTSLHRQHISFCPFRIPGKSVQSWVKKPDPQTSMGLHPGSANGGFQGGEKVMLLFHLRKASASAKVLLSMPLRAHLNLFVRQFTCSTKNHTKVSYFQKGSLSLQSASSVRDLY